MPTKSQKFESVSFICWLVFVFVPFQRITTRKPAIDLLVGNSLICRLAPILCLRSQPGMTGMRNGMFTLNYALWFPFRGHLGSFPPPAITEHQSKGYPQGSQQGSMRLCGCTKSTQRMEKITVSGAPAIPFRWPQTQKQGSGPA